MISRRNIRVKVMQCLYAVETGSGEFTEKEAISLLKKYLEQTENLFLFCILLINEVTRYAETDSLLKAGKHLPSEKDLNVNTKISGNEVVSRIVASSGFSQAIKDRKLERLVDQELVKKIYSELTESETYLTYVSSPERDKKSEKEILAYIFTDLMMADDAITDAIEERFIDWDDDAEMIYQMVLNFLSKPETLDTKEIIGRDKTQYAHTLLKTAIDKKEFTLELIKPKLKNWDPDRIALLDMIMIRLGVCELLYFETIPTKVTINEYIDLAKSYSTQQSGQFVNGILDSIHKELLAEGKLKKIDFKKQA